MSLGVQVWPVGVVQNPCSGQFLTHCSPTHTTHPLLTTPPLLTHTHYSPLTHYSLTPTTHSLPLLTHSHYSPSHCPFLLLQYQYTLVPVHTEIQSKGELLFSSVELVHFGVGCWHRSSSKMHHIWLNRGLSVYLDLYVPDFPKSTSKDLCCTKVVRMHGFMCFTAICYSRMQCFIKIVFLSCSIIQTFPNANV